MTTAEASGLRINGVSYEVPGVTVIGPDDTKWAHLSAGDGRPRIRRPQFGVIHKTKGDLPERVVPGKGPSGRDERVARFWQDDPKHSGAHVVAGSDGRAACLEDLWRFEAWHARAANPRSWGLEIYEEVGGIVFQAALDTAVAIVRVAAVALGTQLQVHRWPWNGKVLARMADGGSTLIGFFAHCHVGDRGRWDSGDEIWRLLRERLGAEVFDFAISEDREVWKDRQLWLTRRGHEVGAIDGLPGPKTTKALAAEGYEGGIWALGKGSR